MGSRGGEGWNKMGFGGLVGAGQKKLGCLRGERGRWKGGRGGGRTILGVRARGGRNTRGGGGAW